MVLQLDNGKYLHTAYAISNIAEELGTDDWSLTDQEGMLYIGTYIDGNSVDSTDPTAYNWEELVDEDVDDEDSEGVMPVADFQSQIDALADQIGIQQSTTEELQESIDNANQNLSSSTELANNAQQIAGNTNQYFWHTESGTDTGAHITEIPQEQFLEDPSNGGGNLLARSNGIAVRDGLEELSTFSADGVVIGKEDGMQTFIGSSDISLEKTAPYVTVPSASYTAGLKITNNDMQYFYNNKSMFNLKIYEAEGYKGYSDFGVTIVSDTQLSITVNTGGEKPSRIRSFMMQKGSQYSSAVRGPSFTAVKSGNSYIITIDVGEDLVNFASTDPTNTIYRIDISSDDMAYSQLIMGKSPASASECYLVIGGGSGDVPANVFTVNSSGGVTASGNITGANLTGSQTADYTGSYKMGNCTILTGSVTINVTTANTNTDKTVTFGPTFKHTPCVQCTMLNIGGSYYQRVTAAGPSTTGFTARIRAGGTPGNVVVNWVAIGELA